MSFTHEEHGDTVVIDVGSQLVATNRQDLRTTISDEMERGTRQFRLDCSRTGFMDSSGLGVLVSLSKQVRERGGELRIANLNHDLRLLFKLTKLDMLFNLDEGGGGAAGAGMPAPVQPPPRATPATPP